MMVFQDYKIEGNKITFTKATASIAKKE